jgi:ADP-ribosylation factor 1/2
MNCQALLRDDELCYAVMLVYANRQDLPDAMNAADLTQRRGLHDIRDHDWYIQVACATMIIGMYEGNTNHC